MGVKVVDPIQVTEAVYSASGIAEPDVSRGEAEWESFEERYESAVVSATGALFAFDIARTNHGELLAAYAAVNNVGIAKFDVNNNLVWSQLLGSETTDPISQLEFIGISVVDDDVVIHWHNNSTGQGNSGKCYRHSFNGFAATGALPPIVSSMNEMPNFPQSIKDSENKRLVEVDGVLFAASNDGYSTSTSVTISTLDPTTGEQSNSKTESLGTGRVEGICPNGSGGVFVCARNSIMIEYNAQLEKIRFKTDIPVAGGFSQLGFYDGIITTAARFTTAGDELMLVDVGSDLNLTTSYKKDDEVITSSNHRKYRCLVDATFSDPRETATGDATAEWIDIGPTNKWALFDDRTTQKTISESDFTIELNPIAYVNTIGFFRIACESIRVVVEDSSSAVIYDKTEQMTDVSTIYDYYTFFFYQNVGNDTFVFDDLPPVVNATIKVTFTGGYIEVGEVVFGFSNEIGHTLADTESRYLNLSRRTYDEFGEVQQVERPSVKLNKYEILGDKATFPAIRRLIEKLDNKNTMWIGDIGQGQKLITYGMYERSPIPYNMPEHVRYSITVRGSI